MRVSHAILTFFAVVLAATAGYAQPKHPHSPHDTLRTKDITITYGRPYKKGREIFGKLEPYGKVYRCGADEATQITFAKDVTFGGKPVKAGTYTFCAIPNAKEWTVILNSKLGQWGAFSYDKYKDQDVVHVNVPVITLSKPVEQLTFSVKNGKVSMAWDTVEIQVPVKM
ncbi:MAG TPA: DUF2911 domain-containing protein [Puia sp.]|nr:DUF2911 domain-containing protein [Puia sp.]